MSETALTDASNNMLYYNIVCQRYDQAPKSQSVLSRLISPFSVPNTLLYRVLMKSEEGATHTVVVTKIEEILAGAVCLEEHFVGAYAIQRLGVIYCRCDTQAVTNDSTVKG